MNVTKRDGSIVPLDIEKIHAVLRWACKDHENTVSISDIEINAKLMLRENIPTSEIHNVLIKSAADLISPKNPDYQFVAANLLNQSIRKEVYNDIFPIKFNEFLNRAREDRTYIPEVFAAYTAEEIEKLDKHINHDRDFNFAYAGLQKMIDKYMVYQNGKLKETPQFTFMLIAMTGFMNETNPKIKMDYVCRTYDHLSLFRWSLPTPILRSYRTELKNAASCTLIDIDDSIDGIMSANHAIARYVASGSGIGINMGRIRATGSPVRKGQSSEARTDGPIPFLKIIQATMTSTKQGIRGGAGTVNTPFWHYDIEDIIMLKNIKGTEENRVRRLDYVIQLSGLLYERAKNGEDITLFSPHEVPELINAWGLPEWDELYVRAEKKKSLMNKKIKAQKLMIHLHTQMAETGRIYISNIDHVNSHGSFKDRITMTNLCVAGNTRIATEFGLIKISDMVNKDIRLSIDKNLTGKMRYTTHCLTEPIETYCTNPKTPLYYMETEDGYNLTATPDHEVFVGKNKKKKICELKEGDPIRISRVYGHFGNDGNAHIGAAIGKAIAKTVIHGETVNASLISTHHLSLKNAKKIEKDINNYRIPEIIYRGTIKTVKAFLKVFFNKPFAKCYDHRFMQELQVLLTLFGETSTIKGSTIYIDSNTTDFLKNIDTNYTVDTSKPKISKVKFVQLSNVDASYDFTQPDGNVALFNGIISGQCVEITHPTKPLKSIEDEQGEIGICLLSAINWGNVNDDKLMESVADCITRFIDNIIDYQDYPVKAASNFTKNRRSLAIGISNLAYFLAKNDEPYGSKKSLELVDTMMERQAYYLTKASMELAKERGPCSAYKLTKYAYGELPIDNYCKTVDELIKPKLRYDWNGLKADLIKYGIRHSTLMACQPVEASSVVHNATNGIEPVRALVTTKMDKKTPVKQVVPHIKTLGNKYTMAFEMNGNEGYLKVCAVIQKWMDMAMSINRYYDITKNGNKINMRELISDTYFGYKYGCKNYYYVITMDGDSESNCSSGACTL